MAIAKPTNQTLIRVYACGGTGYNLGRKLQASFGENSEGLVEVVYMDTSDSNNHALNTPENTVVFGSGKGSGKFRGENGQAIMEGMPAALIKHKPGVFNVTLGGASGGSGSTIINILTGELMSRGITPINFMVGSQDSAAEIKNTNKTFSTFSNLVSAHKLPVLLHYRENNGQDPQEKIDNIVINNLILTCLLLSGKDDKMDITDINHFLNYPSVTNFKPSLVGFELYTDEPALESNEVMLTVATLAKAGKSTSLVQIPEYQTAGRLDEDTQKALVNYDAIHYVTVGNTFGKLMADLAAKVKTFDEAAKAVKLETFNTPNSDAADTASAIVF